jgi:hypothetical protein
MNMKPLTYIVSLAVLLVVCIALCVAHFKYSAMSVGTFDLFYYATLVGIFSLTIINAILRLRRARKLKH